MGYLQIVTVGLTQGPRYEHKVADHPGHKRDAKLVYSNPHDKSPCNQEHGTQYSHSGRENRCCYRDRMGPDSKYLWKHDLTSPHGLSKHDERHKAEPESQEHNADQREGDAPGIAQNFGAVPWQLRYPCDLPTRIGEALEPAKKTEPQAEHKQADDYDDCRKNCKWLHLNGRVHIQRPPEPPGSQRLPTCRQ